MSRYCFLQKAAPLLSFFLLTAASAAALKDTTDPNMAWQNYLDTDTQIEPSYRFPHANCFRVAALNEAKAISTRQHVHAPTRMA
jgi:hypothetical protein